MKISHFKPDLVTQVIQGIETKFIKLSVSRVHKHKFLGMDINFKNYCTVTVQMKDYTQECIDASGLSITHEVTRPARGNLFDVDGKSPLLEGK